MEAGIVKEGEEGATPLSWFSPSPEPVLVEVSTKDGAHIGSKPGTIKQTLETITFSLGSLNANNQVHVASLYLQEAGEESGSGVCV